MGSELLMKIFKATNSFGYILLLRGTMHHCRNDTMSCGFLTMWALYNCPWIFRSVWLVITQTLQIFIHIYLNSFCRPLNSVISSHKGMYRQRMVGSSVTKVCHIPTVCMSSLNWRKWNFTYKYKLVLWSSFPFNIGINHSCSKQNNKKDIPLLSPNQQPNLKYVQRALLWE